MGVVVATIADGPLAGTRVNVEVPTVRVPELPVATFPQGSDLLVLYQEAGNKTTQIDFDALRDFVITGGNPAAMAPVINGNKVQIVISASMANKSRVNVPLLANKMFSLSRRGEGELLDTEYDILPSGGFELNPKNDAGQVVDDNDPTAVPQKVNENDVFIAEIFNYDTGGPNPGTGTTSLFDGLISLTTSTQLSATHRNKLLHAAFGNNSGVITLEDLTDALANSLVVIETMISNTKQTKVAAKAGQKIYFNNTSNDFLWLGISEFLWMLRGDDGWYVIKASEGLLNVGDFEWGYKQKLNMLTARGQEVSRADYPRLWQFVQSLGLGLVDDTTWNSTVSIPDALSGTRTTYKPYEGCYSYGSGGINGSTFRLPNMQDKFVRGLNNIGSTDSQRQFNQPGGVQYDLNRKHHHTAWLKGNGGGEGGISFHDDPNNNFKQITTDDTGGYESRPINGGLLPLIRA